MSTTPVTLSHEEAEKLRLLLNQHDKANLHGSAFDLHKPPVKQYSHKEFPKVVYNHETSRPSRDKKVMQNGTEHVAHVPAKYVTKTVNDEKELKAALAEGWLEKPPNLASLHQGIDFDEPIGDAEEPESDSPDLAKMSRKQLLAHAKDEHGLELDPATKKGDIIAAIQDAQEE